VGLKLAGPDLKDALTNLRDGDTVVDWKLDRLGCGIKGLMDSEEVVNFVFDAGV
jgi:DNA invertase Pin-like site-specific DNA recombinase